MDDPGTTDDPGTGIADAPLPTPRTLRARSNLLVQFGRFVAINAKMVNIIRKERH